jgi:hypothetical protein
MLIKISFYIDFNFHGLFVSLYVLLYFVLFGPFISAETVEQLGYGHACQQKS